MSNDPTLYSPQAARPLEAVLIEVDHLPDGRECYNVRGQYLQAPTGQEWERVVQLLLAGLRAAISQTVSGQAETSRIVQPGGFAVPLTGGH